MDFEENSPSSLVEICSAICLKDLSIFCDADSNGIPFKLKENITLPKEICEYLIRTYPELTGKAVDDEFVRIFHDTFNSRLERVHVQNSSISDEGLHILFRHKITDLDIERCHQLTELALKSINSNASHLVKLNLGSLPQMYSVNAADSTSDREFWNVLSDNGEPILKAPNLKYLKINSVHIEKPFFRTFLEPFKKLTYLNITDCSNLGTLDCISSMPHLSSLILHDVAGEESIIPSICEVKTLRHLDLSQSIIRELEYLKPNYILNQICTSLPLLQSLDISGTNLAGTGVAHPLEDSSSEQKNVVGIAQTDIPGLAVRVGNPLKFLGLLETANDACLRHDIPAITIAGTATEAQVLTAAQVYIDRADYLRRALNELFRIFRYEMCNDQRNALKLILRAMDHHIHDKHIQISGSASLFYIVKTDSAKYLNCKVRKKIVKTLLAAMCEHKYETTMIRNGCLTLCHFRVPQDVLFEYERLVKILLHIVADDEHYGFVHRISMYLLNSLGCQVDGYQKCLIGDLGAIQTMLKLIEDRWLRSICDDVMEIAWSAMWNITDETPTNCERFLDGDGMTLFLRCLRKFSHKAELLRNMMGLLGNVAEVKHLRPRLMEEEYLTVFSELLDNWGDGIEVSYNAAGILSHIASDGPALWTDCDIKVPSRDIVLARLQSAISNWDIKAARNINYRSFEPILRLVKCECSPEAQYWAVWALANLSGLYPHKYCQLIKDEGGIEMLQELLESTTPFLCTKELAEKVISNCARFRPFWGENATEDVNFENSIELS